MSFTHDSMLGKKYNKLLRSVALILSPLIHCDKGDIQYMFLVLKIQYLFGYYVVILIV